MGRLPRKAGALATIACLTACALLGAPPPRGTQRADRCNVSGTVRLSDRVAGAYSALVREGATARLEAVILARGRAGWHSERARSAVADGPPPLPAGRRRSLAGAGFGGLVFAYERDSGIAWIGRRPFRVSPGNLLLVEGVDSAASVLATVPLPATVHLTRPGCTTAGEAELSDSVDALLGHMPALTTFLAPRG